MQQKKKKDNPLNKITLENYYRHIRKINFPPINEMLS